MASKKPWYYDIQLMFADMSKKIAEAIEKHKNRPRPEPKQSGMIAVHKGLYYATIFGYFSALLLAAAIFADFRWLLLGLAAVHFLASVEILSVEERGAVLMLGIPVLESDKPGPKIVLRFIMTMLRVPRAPVQYQFPDEPEYVQVGDDKLPLEEIIVDGVLRSKVRPFRFMSGGPRDENSEVPYSGHLNVQMGGMISGSVQVEIEQTFNFIMKMPGRTVEKKFAALRQRLQDTWGSTLVKETQTRPAGLIIDEVEKIRLAQVTALEERTTTWGVKIPEVLLFAPDYGHDVNKSLAGIAETRAEAEQIRTRTDAQAYQTRESGKAAADADLAMKMADNLADADRVEKLGITGPDMFAAEAAERMLKPTDNVYLGISGIVEGLGLPKALKGLFGKKEEAA